MYQLFNTLQPINNNNPYAITMCSSSEFTPYLAVYLQSIKEHAESSNFYDIIVFEKDIEDNIKQLFVDCFTSENFSLRFYNLSCFLENEKFYVNGSNFHELSYSRFVVPIILNDYKKIIFTDIDLIVSADIYELFNFDMQDYPLAAAREILWKEFYANQDVGTISVKDYTHNILKLDDYSQYYNTGVIVIDVVKYKEGNYLKKLLDACAANNFYFQEQCAISSVFKNNICSLPYEWNFCVLPFKPFKGDYSTYKACWKNAKIIHYFGTCKPWRNPSGDKSYLWWGYARKTPLYEIILQRYMNHQFGEITNIANYRFSRIEYCYYKVLSKLTWGEKRKQFEEKRKQLKILTDDTRNIIKKIKAH